MYMNSKKCRVHIIYCHPSKKSITYKIKEAYLSDINKELDLTLDLIRHETKKGTKTQQKV